MDHTRPSLTLGIESIRKSFLDAKNRDVKLRYITEHCRQDLVISCIALGRSFLCGIQVIDPLDCLSLCIMPFSSN